MGKNSKTLRLSLQFFADGTAVEAGAAADGSQGFELTPRMKELQEKYNVDFGFDTGSKKNEGVDEGRLASGNNADGTEAEAPSKTAEEEFEELIAGKYREAYEKKSAARTKEAIQKRFKASEENSKKTSKYEKALSRLAHYYGKEKSDYSGIADAAINDDKWFEDEAFEKNTSAKALREAEDTNEELRQLRSRISEQEAAENKRITFEKWARESKATKELYPNFDEAREFSDPKFIAALKFHGNVEDAYVATHFKEILAATAKAVEGRTTENVTRMISRGKSHPTESASVSRAAMQSSFDPSKLSKTELAEYRRMIDRGEDPFRRT